MTAIDQQRGSASSQEEIWRARDYAELEEGVDRADYSEGLRRIANPSRQRTARCWVRPRRLLPTGRGGRCDSHRA